MVELGSCMGLVLFLLPVKLKKIFPYLQGILLSFMEKRGNLHFLTTARKPHQYFKHNMIKYKFTVLIFLVGMLSSSSSICFPGFVGSWTMIWFSFTKYFLHSVVSVACGLEILSWECFSSHLVTVRYFGHCRGSSYAGASWWA